MSETTIETPRLPAEFNRSKFTDPRRTADGSERASIYLEKLETLWINTGTLCNIECANCYIESSPTNDRLAYISAAEVAGFLDEIRELKLETNEIAFTGGEPFMNPGMIDMARDALSRGHEVLILSNAMQPMQRKRVREGLLALKSDFGNRLSLRISLDHYTMELHETERGADSWEKALEGLDWLSENAFRVSIAGRTCWNEDEEKARAGYAGLIEKRGWSIDAQDTSSLILFPEMIGNEDVPEITTDCWSILGVDPRHIMCATSRMVVKRKGEAKPTVLPCTLLPYDAGFNMGETLAQSMKAHGGMFNRGAVSLCHPYCAKFCVLGGASCSA